MDAKRKAQSYINLGQAYLLAGNHKRACEILKKAQEAQPRAFRARLLLARAHGAAVSAGDQDGGYEQAVKVLLDGLPAGESHQEGLEELIRLYTLTEDRMGLQRLLQEGLKTELAAHAERVLARMALDEGGYAEALERFQVMAARDGTAQAWEDLGDAHFLKENYSDALESYARALAAAEPNTRVLRNVIASFDRLADPSCILDRQDQVAAVGEALAREGRVDEAVKWLLERARIQEEKLARGGEDERLGLARTWRILTATYLAKDQAALAVEAARRVLDLDPEDTDGLRLLVDAYEQQWNLEKAVAACERLARIAPDEVSLCALGNLYHRCGRLREAIEAITRAADVGADVLCTMVDIFEQLLQKEGSSCEGELSAGALANVAAAALPQDAQRAERLLRLAVSKDASSWRARILLGKALAKQEREAEAVRELKMAVRIAGGSDLSPLLELVWQYAMIDDADAALEACRRGLQTHGQDADLLFAQAVLLSRVDRRVEALSALNEACAMRPSMDFLPLGGGEFWDRGTRLVALFEQLLGIPPSHDDLVREGRELLKRRQYVRADAVFRKALEVQKRDRLFSLRDHALLLLFIGICESNIGITQNDPGRLEKSLELLQESVRYNSADPRPHYIMAEVYQRLGLADRAKKALQEAGRVEDPAK